MSIYYLIFIIFTVVIYIVNFFLIIRAYFVHRNAEIVNTETPRVSVLMPVYNEEVGVIFSVESLLNQDYPSFDLIIVDDGSTDMTAEIVKKVAQQHPWIHYVHRSNRGERRVGPGVIEAFYDGFKSLRTKDYDFIGKIDGLQAQML